MTVRWGSYYACDWCGAFAGQPCRDTWLRLGFGPWRVCKRPHKARTKVNGSIHDALRST